jgi:hypothetical protein
MIKLGLNFYLAAPPPAQPAPVYPVKAPQSK